MRAVFALAPERLGRPAGRSPPAVLLERHGLALRGPCYIY
jgi:hypothetical protein